MLMYYFNLVDKYGRVAQDKHGEDISDDAAAVRHAGAVARDLSGPNGTMDFQQGSNSPLQCRIRSLATLAAHLLSVAVSACIAAAGGPRVDPMVRRSFIPQAAL
jgi:hypothetical protein